MPRDQVGFQTPLEAVYDEDAVHNPDPVVGAEIADSNTRDRAGFQTPLEALYDEGGVHNPNPVIGTAVTDECSPGGTLSGIYGAVVADNRRIARVTQWSIQVTASGKKWVDTSIAGWAQFIPSVLSASGSFEFKYDNVYTQHSHIWPGYSVGLILALSEIPNSAALQVDLWYIPSAIITDIAMTVDIASGEIISGTASWTASGIVHPPQYKFTNQENRVYGRSTALSVPVYGTGLNN